jgi:cytochrome P450
MSLTGDRDVPDHVPDHLVYDFDYFTAPRGMECPQLEVARKLHSEAPDIFYTPRNGGHWVVTRYEAGLEITRHHHTFSNDPLYNDQRRMYPRFTPLDYDPPEHTELRRVISPAFTPAAVHAMSNGIRDLARELVDDVYPRGGCEFVTEIAQRYPVTLFLKMADAPLADRAWMIEKADEYVRGLDFETRSKGRAQLGEYLADLLKERTAKPGRDLMSLIVTSRLPDRALTEDEKLGMAALCFFAGLDTVVSMLSFIINFLARNPVHYRQLVADPATIDRGLEDLIRVHGTNCTRRGVSQDFEFRGIEFKTGDRLVFLRPIIGLDDRCTRDAHIVDFNREVSSSHLAFGAGVHRCLGSHLARVEMRTFLEEWTRRIPEFRAGPVEMSGGGVWTPTSLPLFWDIRA